MIGFGNRILTTLTEDVDTTQTYINIADTAALEFADLFDIGYTTIVIAIRSSSDDSAYEIMYAHSVDTDTGVLSVERAQEGSTALAFQAGDYIYNTVTASTLQQLIDQAAIVKPHTSTTNEYGSATSTEYGHIKLTDDYTDASPADSGIGISSLGATNAFNSISSASLITILTTSGEWIVPNSANYTITVIAGGGNGGNGGNGDRHDGLTAAGGGGGGGGAGEVVSQTFYYTAGTVIPYIVGGAQGNSTWGSEITAHAGSRGGNGGNGYWNWYGGRGGAGGAGYPVGGAGANGMANDHHNTSNRSAGGIGATSAQGVYGNGGNGGYGGQASYYGTAREPGGPGASGTAGAIIITVASRSRG